MDRARRRAEAEKAYKVQVEAGTIGALRATGVGVGLAIIGHYTWPWFRCVCSLCSFKHWSHTCWIVGDKLLLSRLFSSQDVRIFKAIQHSALTIFLRCGIRPCGTRRARSSGP